MHVDQGIEAAVGAGEEPVDGAFFVHLDVVFIEIPQEVFLQVLPEGVFDELQVFGVVFLAECNPQELLKAGDSVIFEPLSLDDRDDIGFGGGEGGFIPDYATVIFNCFTLVGKDQEMNSFMVSSNRRASSSSSV
jgi:hypothetical protein